MIIWTFYQVLLEKSENFHSHFQVHPIIEEIIILADELIKHLY